MSPLTTTLELAVWTALEEVHDPEIPPCRITDLGIVERVSVDDDAIEVDLVPTFAGCPALDVIAADVRAAVQRVGEGRDVRVRFVYAPPWTSDRITPAGREALREYGVTPPRERSAGTVFLPLAERGSPARSVTCPFCGSQESDVESAFGPTLCRSTHFCRSCRNPFEAFKPKG